MAVSHLPAVIGQSWRSSELWMRLSYTKLSLRRSLEPWPGVKSNGRRGQAFVTGAWTESNSASHAKLQAHLILYLHYPAALIVVRVSGFASACRPGY